MSSFLMDIDECPWNLAGRSARLAPEEVHVWRSHIDSSLEESSTMELTLSEDEARRAGRFRGQQKQWEFILGRGLLRLLLGSYIGCDPKDLQFTAGPYGKPGLAAGFTSIPIQFNVSHSSGAVLHAFALGRRVGVDIEKVRTDFSGLDVARRFFDHQETCFLSSKPEAQQPAFFFGAWTRKEALLKARGEGLAGHLDRTGIPFPFDRKNALLGLRESGGASADWFLTELDAGLDFAAALAVEGNGVDVYLRRWRSERPQVAVNTFGHSQPVLGAETGCSFRV
jgi:4'-phosphopantetheinyl transferase